jgi:hypothetical protein
MDVVIILMHALKALTIIGDLDTCSRLYAVVIELTLVGWLVCVVSLKGIVRHVLNAIVKRMDSMVRLLRDTRVFQNFQHVITTAMPLTMDVVVRHVLEIHGFVAHKIMYLRYKKIINEINFINIDISTVYSVSTDPRM